MINYKKILALLAVLLLALTAIDASARTKETGKDKNDDELEKRDYNLVFDCQQNTVSNISFYTTNYGIFGLNVARGIGGGFWPRGSQNQYIFGGGIWFGAVKPRPSDKLPMKLVEVSYNPNSGKSWMVPGRIEDGDAVDNSNVKKYRTYFSTDFKRGDGKPLNPDDGSTWPIWDDDATRTVKEDRYFGHFIWEENKRTRTVNPKGPVFISGEDIFATYKDTDLSKFEGGAGIRKKKGYPFRLQFEQMIYSWGFGDYRDFIFIKYEITNKSKDTLMKCWMAPVMDVDIARAASAQTGAANDWVRYYEEDTTLNLCLQWSNTNLGEKGYGFGYLGFDFLESPATDSNEFVRKDKRVYYNSEQLGLKTFKNWPINLDILDDEPRYNAMAAMNRDGQGTSPGDKRFMMATGPFNMRPNDTVRVVVGMILANPAVKKDADGSIEDSKELVRKDIFAQMVYDNNFKAPEPPERSIFVHWEPLNNAMLVQWDSTSEKESTDIWEGGLDFMGYKLFRARRTNLDTFDISDTKPDNNNPLGKGPFGWKEIASYEIPTPFLKSVHRAGGHDDDPSWPAIDSLKIVGPDIIDFKTNTPDVNNIKVMRIGKGIILWGSDMAYLKNYTTNLNLQNVLRPKVKGVYPFIMGIDTLGLDFTSKNFKQPWGAYFYQLYLKDHPPVDTLPSIIPMWHDPLSPTPTHNYLLDSVLLGRIELNPALVPCNPLLWERQPMKVGPKMINDTLKRDISPFYRDSNTDYVYIKNTLTMDPYDPTSGYIDVYVPIKDTVTKKWDFAKIMSDTVRLKHSLDMIYSYIQKGQAKIIFPSVWDRRDSAATQLLPTPFEQTSAARSVISKYMDEITNHRTFIDIGDDNGNHIIESSDDPSKTEKLINNVDYYYKIISWDEGDYTQPTPMKYNDASPGLPNMVTVYPKAAPIGEPLSFKVISVDSALIGSFHNFNLYAIDPDKARQLFSNHELELEFTPVMNQFSIPWEDKSTTTFGLYYRNIKLTDLVTKEVLYNNTSMFEVTPCFGAFRGAFSENASSYIGLEDFGDKDTAIVDPVKKDTITFQKQYDHHTDARSGSFTTGDFSKESYCYSYGASPSMLGTLGFSFDYKMEQGAGVFRADPLSVQNVIKPNNSPAITLVSCLPNADVTQPVDTTIVGWTFVSDSAGNGGVGSYPSVVEGSFNNGRGDYLITFKPGGEEKLTLSFGQVSAIKQNTFSVKYLNIDIKNTYKMDMTNELGVNQPVSYEKVPLKHIVLPLKDDSTTPNLVSLHNNFYDFYTEYNLTSYGWVNARRNNRKLPMKNQSVKFSFIDATGKLSYGDRPIGTRGVGSQGRYYLSAISDDGVDTLDFVNVVKIAGADFVFDYANKGNRTSSEPSSWVTQDTNTYSYGGPDFKEGDQVVVKTFGGAFGLPLPGAKVRFKIEDAKPNIADLTDNNMDGIKVVPNPYYISQEGQKSPYDSRLYFTKLPKQCTIDIYTVNGDLIRSIKHDEIESPDPSNEAVEIWDLLSKNRQRIQSQALVAVITAPNGAKTVKEFSIVVGGFRIVNE